MGTKRADRCARRMRVRAARCVVSAALFAALAAAAPAQAGNYTGTILLPAASPGPARTLYNASPPTNGTVGYVIKLNGPVAAGSTYSIRTLNGVPPLDFDAYFYSSIAGTGTPCTHIETRIAPDREDGLIDCEARYAVVVLFTGAAGQFKLTV